MKKKLHLILLSALILSLLSMIVPATTVGATECVLKGRMTGGGSLFTSTGDRITHGFELYAPATLGPNNLEVNWGGNHFHLEDLVESIVVMDPLYGPPNPPNADFNEIRGEGIGRYNGVNGYEVIFCFTDSGEPGVNDTAYIKITAPDGTDVLDVFGTLQFGNQQAHNITGQKAKDP